jgi:hypothetical protein
MDFDNSHLDTPTAHTHTNKPIHMNMCVCVFFEVHLDVSFVAVGGGRPRQRVVEGFWGQVCHGVWSRSSPALIYTLRCVAIGRGRPRRRCAFSSSDPTCMISLSISWRCMLTLLFWLRLSPLELRRKWGERSSGGGAVSWKSLQGPCI